MLRIQAGSYCYRLVLTATLMLLYDYLLLEPWTSSEDEQCLLLRQCSKGPPSRHIQKHKCTATTVYVHPWASLHAGTPRPRQHSRTPRRRDPSRGRARGCTPPTDARRAHDAAARHVEPGRTPAAAG